MMPRGSVASAEPSGGVTQPSRQVGEGSPRRGGGRWGSAGCVGEAMDEGVAASGPVDGPGDGETEGVDPAGTAPSSDVSPSQAASENAAASSTAASTENLRIEVTIPRKGGPEDTVEPPVW